jgi:hypothetical protein
MQFVKNITISLSGLILTIIGEYLVFRVYTHIEFDIVFGLLGIISFIIIFTGCILFLTPFFNLWIELDKQLKSTQSKYRNLINVVAFFLSCIPFIVAGKVFYYYTGKYHTEQLQQNGVVTKVKIKSEITGNNSRHDLYFDFIHNGEKWEGSLGHWKYEVGDSVEIIYSSENPNEVSYYELFKAEYNSCQ